MKIIKFDMSLPANKLQVILSNTLAVERLMGNFSAIEMNKETIEKFFCVEIADNVSSGKGINHKSRGTPVIFNPNLKTGEVQLVK